MQPRIFNTPLSLSSFLKSVKTRTQDVQRAFFFVAVMLVCSVGAYGQTTYNWIGGNSSWATAANWSSVPGGNPRTTPATTDILQFNDGGTYTVTALPATQTIRQLLITNNTSIILQAATTTTLTITGVSGSTGLQIASGSVLSNSASNIVSFVHTGNGQLGDISGTLTILGGTAHGLYGVTVSGTLNMNLGTLTINNSTYPTTFTATGILNHTAGTITSTTGGLSFLANSNYNYLAPTTALTIPTATWDAASKVNITGITGAVTILGINGQSFGIMTYNCLSQGNVAVSLASGAATYTVKGNFNIQSTGSGTGTLSFKSGTSAVAPTINGTLNISGGSIVANSGLTSALTLTTGDYTQSGGLFNLSSVAVACTLNIDGNLNQSAGTLTQTSTTVSLVQFRGANKTYTTAGTVTNTNLNYAINTAGASLTLNNGMVIPTGRNFTVTNGTLYCGTNIVSGAGSFIVANSANASLGIGDQLGIVSSLVTMSGNIQTTTARTFNLAANYIYTGTNGQVTGTGLAASVTGSVTVNLTNPSDQITFTNTLAIGAAGTLKMVRGQLANAITYNATGKLEYASTTGAQTTTNNEFPAATGPGTLIINNANGVTLHAARTVSAASGALTLTSGILNTATNSAPLYVSNTAVAAVSGGSSTSYVQGALQRNLATTVSQTYSFPVGKSAYQNVDFFTVLALTNTFVMQAEVFDAAPAGGTAGLNLSAIGNRYWALTKISGTGDIAANGGRVTLTDAGAVADSRVGYSSTVGGAYSNIGGTLGTGTLQSTVAFGATPGYFVIGTTLNLTSATPYSVGPTGNYLNLTAVANALKVAKVTGNVIFEMQATYNGTSGETFPIVFNQFATDGGTYTVMVRPENGASMLTTSGDPGSASATMIDLDGISGLTFDGRAGGSGSTIGWTFRNTRTASTFNPTFRFINDASGNTLTYVQVEGQNTTASSGTIVFSTTTASSGNDNNTISYCNIGDNGTGTAANGIYSLGTAAKLNSGNQVLNNNIYNNYNSLNSPNSGIFLTTNNTDWTIQGNSFYQTASRANGNGISFYPININNTGDNFIVKGNYIGGSQALAAGSAYTITGTASGTFTGIYLQPSSSATGCKIEDNVIANIDFSHGTSLVNVVFVGIRSTQGSTLIKNNTIGSTTAANSIIIRENFGSSPPCVSNGIIVDGGSAVVVEDNKIGGINAGVAGALTIGESFYGIFISAVSNPSCTVQNNIIGSTNNTANSVYASSASASATGQFLIGIQVSSSAATTITNNNINNLTNASVNTSSALSAITLSPATTTATYNVYSNPISKLTGSLALNAINQNGVGTSLVANIYLNTISECSSGAASAAVAGIRINQGGTNNVYRNKLYDLSASGATPSVIGVATGNSSATVTSNVNLSNNIIGDLRAPNANSASDVIRGVSIGTYSFTGRINMYYNTIYLEATSAGTNFSTSGVFHTYNATTTRGALESRNNIIVNKSTPNGTGNTVAFRQSDPLAINANFVSTSNNNVYYAGTPSSSRLIYIGNTSNPAQTLANYKATVNLSPRDQASFTENVPFTSTAGTSIDFLHLNPTSPTQAESGAVAIASYIDDYDATGTRPAGGYPLGAQLNGGGTAPDIGADEGDFTTADLAPPTFSTITMANACNNGTTVSGSAAITDPAPGVGVNNTSGNKPRIYYKKATDSDNNYNDNTSGTTGWKYVEATNATSAFTFTLDLTKLSALVAGESIQYFVTAEDVADVPNVGISNSLAFAATPSSVDLTTAAFPISGTPATFVVLPCSGTVTVGNSGANYTAFTTATGLFQAINLASAASLVNGDLIVNVTSDISIEDGVNGLNQFASPHTLLIQSSSSTQRIISGDNTGATGLFRMTGADRVTFNGGSGSTERRLLFRNTGVAGADAVFAFSNDATNITINNCRLEGAPNSVASGVVVFGAATSTGNDDITISNCDIRQTASGLPSIGVYAVGTTSSNDNVKISGCNISNFFNASSITAYAGVYVGALNSGWTIENNRFFQSATRTITGAVQPFSIIRVDNTSGTGFMIDGNIIGATDSIGTGTLTYTSATSPQMAVIYMNVGTSTLSTIKNNEISKFSFTTISAGTGNQGTFSGIFVLAGKVDIKDNIIGAASGATTLAVTINTNASGQVNGIKTISTSTVNITGNTIGSFTGTGTGTNNGVTVNGINFTAGTVTVSGNFIGSSGTTNSLQTNGTVTSTSNSSLITGINGSASSIYSPMITGNYIYNLNNSNTGTSNLTAGILTSGGGQYSITGNTVRDLSSAGVTTGTGASSSVLGISINSAPVGLAHTISGNTVSALTNTSAANTVVTGIYFAGGSTASTVSKNLVYNLRSGTGTSSVVTGIHLGGNPVSASNNMVRLGYDATGTAITNTSIITGILKDNTTANSIYYNSVYIGGTGVLTTANNTYAFRRLQAGSTDNVRNNIFWNARSNNTTGGKHYAVHLISTATLTQDYNLLYATGTGNVLGAVNTTDYSNMNAWKGGTVVDDNSVSGNPQFTDATGTTPNLNLSTTLATPAESGATAIAGLTDDYGALNVRTGYPQGGQVNGGGTAPDMGADEGDFIPADVTPPYFTYTSIPLQALCNPITTTVSVTITDAQSGISLSANKPRMYFRRSVGGAPGNNWDSGQFVEGTYTSGTTNVSVWSFSITYSNFGITPVGSNSFEYYFVAQDLNSTPNVGYSQSNGTTPVHSPDVAGSTTLTLPNYAFPASGTYSFNSAISGTVTVGTSGTYSTFNGSTSSAFFYDLAQRGISSDLIVNVISDVAELANYYPMSAPTEYCGSGYTITIKPVDGTLRTIASNTSGANALIEFAGAKRVVIDGSYNNGGQYLLFRQGSTSVSYVPSTFYFGAGSQNITIKNCQIQGNNFQDVSATNYSGPGVINFGVFSAGTSPVTNISIENNIIRNNPNTSGNPMVLVCGGILNSTDNPVKSNITIKDNEMFGFQRSAVYAAANSNGSGIGSYFTITGNKIYQPGTFTVNPYPIYLDDAGTGKGHVISNNKIGGNALPSPNITGTWSIASNCEFWPIYVFTGGASTADNTVIQNNTISNIALTGTGTVSFVGILADGAGYYDISGNTVGNPASANSITNAGGALATNYPDMIGIWASNPAEATISGNTVSNLVTTNYYSYLDGIVFGSNIIYRGSPISVPGGKATITGNTISNLFTASGLQAESDNEGLVGLFLHSNSMNNSITGNSIYNLQVNGNRARNVQVYGAMLGVIASASNTGGTISGNKIYNLVNNNSGDPSGGSIVINPEMYGISIGYGNWNIANNMVYLSNPGVTTRNTAIYGITDWLLNANSSQAANYYYNTVYLSGTNSGTPANPSYSFFRFPVNNNYNHNTGTGTSTTGAATTLRNNLFINDRSGTGNHRAIGNFSTVNPATGWNASASDYNFFAAPVASTTTLWGSTNYSFSNWKTQSGGDANSTNATTTTGSSTSTTVNPAELFVDPSTGDLELNINNTAYTTFCDNLGTPVSGITTDLGGESRSASTPDIGADEVVSACAPTVDVTANTTATNLTVCSGTSVTLAASLTGGSCTGSFEFAWSNGSNYWNGTSFGSGTPVYNASYASIVLTSPASATYSAEAKCSNNSLCAGSGSVDVQVLSAPATVSAAIGSPANGTEHHLIVTWTAVSGVTGYDIEYSNNGTSWSPLTSVGTVTTYDHNTGNNPNVAFYYRVRAKDGSFTCAWTEMTTPRYTAADLPAAPTVNGATSTTLNITLAAETPVANPAITTYSIYEENTGLYVQANGTLGATEVFQTKAAWSTKTVTGLSVTTQYCFYARAKNNDGDIRGGNYYLTEQFNSNVLVTNGNSSQWYIPSASGCSYMSNTPYYPRFTYSSLTGCSAGSITYQGDANWGYEGCLTNAPEIDMNGIDNVEVTLNVTNNASGASDNLQFSVWVNSGYLASSQFTVDGVAANKLYFGQARSCALIKVLIDLSTVPVNSRSDFRLQIVTNCENATNCSGYFAAIDNVKIGEVNYSSCGTTTSCTAGTWTAGDATDKTNWFDADNWSCGTIPTSTIDVVIPTNPTGGNYFPVITHATLDAATKDLTIQTGASVTISYPVTAGVPDGELQVNGVLTNNSSTTSMGSGFLTMKAGSSISGNLLVDYLKIDGNSSLAASANVGVKKELALRSGTFDVSNGTLTIESDINGTGYINDFDFSPATGPFGTITGNVTMERYIPSTGGSNIFHYIGGITSATAGSKWSDDFNMGVTGTTGFITPGNCDPANPTTAQGSNYGGFFSYHESNVTNCYLSGWKVEDANYSITPGKGIAARIGNGVIIEETGTYHASTVALSNLSKTAANAVAYSQGYNLVSNPYYAPIDWSAVAADNTGTWDGAAYVYNPGSGTYSAFNFLTNQLTINTNQAFFVRAANATGASSALGFTFNADTRTKGTNTTFYRQQQGYAYGLNINVLSNTGKNDNTLLAFDSLFTDVFDNGLDAMKLYNDVGVPSVYTKSGNDQQAIQALPLISANTRSVPLSILITTNGTHTFSFNGIEDFPQTTIVWLEDLKTGTIQYLRQNNVYAFTANVGDDKDRFVIHFSPELLIATTTSDCSGNNGTIALEQRGGIEWTFRLKDANNAVITSDVFSTTELINQLAPGTYTLDLTHPASGYATTMTIIVTGLQPVSAALDAPVTEVLENETFTVDAQTTGATTYIWQMGDGTIFTDVTSVNYAYATTGAYEIILTASNDGCSAVATIKISVSKQDTVSTGVPSVESGAIGVFENGDVLFISQTVMKQDVDARVTVYNALGQVIAQADVKQLAYKAVYQMPVSAAAGIYYVSVELADGEKALKKVMLGEDK